MSNLSKEDFRNELMFQTTMHIARKMFDEGLISEEDYNKIEDYFLEKYKPIFGNLFTGIR